MIIIPLMYKVKQRTNVDIGTINPDFFLKFQKVHSRINLLKC